ncbi:MAG: hypothetical protein J0I20_16615 [Chloroflexi bacterium]|nr:hypothetical protein [Chloroflexota bacterium]OJV88767.1 MAG: hypothetical protein BGO39_04500 [Chloroflexi bacterium 54-19]
MAVRLAVEPDESLDGIIARLKNYNSQEVLLVLPSDTHALQDLNSFTALRNTVRAENIHLTIAGGNKTIRALANLLGFAIEKPVAPAPVAGPTSGQGTVVRPDYSSVADGFVGVSPDQNFPRPNPPLSQVNTPSRPTVTPQNPAGNQPTRPVISNNPAVGPTRQPIPQPGFNLAGSAAAPVSSTTEDRTRNGFFAVPDTGKLSGTTPVPKPEAAKAKAPESSEPIPGFLDELIEEDTAAGLFRARQTQVAPRPPVGPFFANRRPARSGPGDLDANQLDDGLSEDDLPEDYDIEEVPDPDADPADEVVAASGRFFTRKRPAQPVRTKLRPVAGAVAGPAVAPKGGILVLTEDRRRTLTLALAVLFALLLVVVLFLLLVRPGGIMTIGPSVQNLTVPLKTEVQTNTIRLELVAGSAATSPAPAGTQAATVPTGATGASTTPGTPAATATATPPPPATLPVEMVNTGEIKKSGEAPTTGIRKVPDQPARGPVVFYNRSFSAKSFGAGTVIYTRNGVTYRLVRAITIDGSTQFNGQAGQATGEVVADKAGTVGNIAEIASFPINENVGVGLGPLTTGTDRDEKFITQADQDALKKQLEAQARAEVNNALKYDQTTQGVLVLKTTDPVCTFPQKVNDAADTVSGSCTTSLQAARYRTADVASAAATHFVTDPALQLDGQTPLEFVGPPKLIQDQGTNFVEVQVRGRVIHLLDTNVFKTAIAGKTKAELPAFIAANFPQVDLDQLDLGSIKVDPLPTANLLDLKTVLDYEAANLKAQATTQAAPPGGATSGVNAATSTPKS